MSEHQNPNSSSSSTTTTTNKNSNNPSPPPNKSPTEIKSNGNGSYAKANNVSGGQKIHYPNPPDPMNPDAATLREQWKFAIKQYSRWYSQAWGTAILAGISFFALGWVIKGGNPLPSFRNDQSSSSSSSSSSSEDDNETRR